MVQLLHHSSAMEHREASRKEWCECCGGIRVFRWSITRYGMSEQCLHCGSGVARVAHNAHDASTVWPLAAPSRGGE